ncbi:cupin domain-containing protein [Cohnella sp. GCM10020058]|uniref:cupin domain-containing protein n=1 Tax=Cohnella sp. GCM10020058 TaxID=3317330 RepID=UPI003629B1A2
MLLRNIYEAKRKRVMGMHDGEGPMEFARVCTNADFGAPVDFIDYAVVPPGSAIGAHRHRGNEELYLILKGRGSMQVGASRFAVKEGDLILNPDGSTHSLHNCGSDEIHLFVVQVPMPAY